MPGLTVIQCSSCGPPLQRLGGPSTQPYAVERLSKESAPLPYPWPVAARDALVSLLGAGRAAIPVWRRWIKRISLAE